jgi:hypothetical protein
MLKRIILTLTFAAAFGAAGLCMTNNSDAQGWRWNRPYASYYYAPRAYYGYGVPYRTYYRGYDYYYAPRSYNYYSYYDSPGYYYYQPRVAVQVGPGWWR